MGSQAPPAACWAATVVDHRLNQQADGFIIGFGALNTISTAVRRQSSNWEHLRTLDVRFDSSSAMMISSTCRTDDTTFS